MRQRTIFVECFAPRFEPRLSRESSPPCAQARGGAGGESRGESISLFESRTRETAPPLPPLGFAKGGSPRGEGGSPLESNSRGRTEDSRFRALLADADWRSLPTAVRARFSRKVEGGESVLYRGETTHLKFSPLGRLLAQAARLVGAPLPLDDKAERRPAVVAVTEAPSGHGQIWTRVYSRRRGFPQMVNSVKRFAGPTGLEEHVGAGVSMSLTLAVADGTLLFASEDYFLTVFGRKAKIPRALTPGAMTIGHRDLGDGAFLFTLTLVHPRFGALIEQSTVFHDMEEAYDRRSRLEPHIAADAVRDYGYACAS